MRDDGPHGVFVADVVLFRRACATRSCASTSLSADFKARLVAPADQTRPGNLRPQPALERVRARAAAGKNLRQFLRVDAHVGWRRWHKHFPLPNRELRCCNAWPRATSKISSIRLSSTSLRVGTFLLLSWMNLVAMLDIERRDRLAIDERDDLLRAGRRRNGEHDRSGEHRR